MAVVDFHSLDATKKKEMVLRDIYESEELKINSSRTELNVKKNNRRLVRKRQQRIRRSICEGL